MSDVENAGVEPSDPKTHEPQQRKKMHQAAFLSYFERTAHIGQSAEAAHVTRWAHYEWMKTDPEYVKQFQSASSIATLVLEDEVIRRAVHGVEEPVYYEGKVVGGIRKFSDVLLMFKLKQLKPEYRENFSHRLVDDQGKDRGLINPSALTALIQQARDEDPEGGASGASASS